MYQNCLVHQSLSVTKKTYEMRLQRLWLNIIREYTEREFISLK